MIVESIDPRPHMYQNPVYGSLIYIVFDMSERLLTQANQNSRSPPRTRTV